MLGELIFIIISILGVVLSTSFVLYMYNQPSPKEVQTTIIKNKASNVSTTPLIEVKPKDCKMSDWSEWSVCSNPCGGGERTRTRQVLINGTNGGLECGHSIEREVCNEKSCPVDCKVSEWSDWNACDVACGGGGKQTRSRTILRQGGNGGVACPITSEVRECGQQPCPTDCKVSEWSNWTECDKTCGEGTQKRNRKVVEDAKDGGKECPLLVETQPCNMNMCPTDCEVSEWSQWSACDKPCGEGKQQRTRTILVPASNGGSCPPLIEVKSCNTQSCAADCEVSNWSDWSSCSKTWGGGRQMRKRTVNKPASYGGKDCPTLAETQDCNIQDCPTDCEVGPWSEWGVCNKSCGGGTQTRTRNVTKPATNGGKTCPILTETQTCNPQACPPPPPTLSTNGKCGPGNGNTQCPDGQCCSTTGVCGTTASECSTNRRTDLIYHGKNAPLANVFDPVNCEVSAWSSWDTCDKPCGTGSQTRTRTITKPAAYGGTVCPTLNEKQSCNTQACPVNCETSAWSSWSTCSKTCGSGTQTRTRTITKPASNGGQDCGGLVENQSCNTQPCPSDCVMSDWSSWSTCSKTCGGGTQTRTRTVVKPAANGGQECGTLTETQSCNTQACPVDCAVSDWSLFGSCSKTCGGGTQSRTRSIVTQSANGGTSCPSLTDTQPCNTQPCATDCVLTDWSAWSTCDKECGPGQQVRTRSVMSQPTNGGVACPNPNTVPQEYKQTKDCKIKDCPVPCVQSGWGEWGKCTFGKRTRTRTTIIPAKNGGFCGPEVEVGDCPGSKVSTDGRCGPNFGDTRCPDGQCCSTSGVCGTTKTECATNRMAGDTYQGINAPTSSSFDPVNCELNPWSSWSACDNKCGTGSQFRSTTVKTQPRNGGTSCPPTTQLQFCNDTSGCPVNCTLSEWGPWSACSTTCGNGTQSRSRTVVAPARNGGSCDSTTQSQSCSSTSGCPVNCQVGNWGAWGACSASCGGGTQTRTRSITTQPANGGASCPSLSESVSCNTQACNDTLTSPNCLIQGNCIVSRNGLYKACQQYDGHFVVYKGTTAIFATGQFGTNSQVFGSKLCLQNDGNLVNYNGSSAYWSTQKFASGGGNRAVMQDDGNFVVYNKNGGVVWATNTQGR